MDKQMLNGFELKELKHRKFHATQIGSREYYNYPSVLFKSGKLASFSTDIWTPWAQNLPLPKSLARLKSRYNPTLKDFSVRSQNFIQQFLMVNKKTNCRFTFWEQQGKAFGEWAINNILKSGIDKSQATFGFTNANLEIMQMAKTNGALAVHGQIDPGISWYNTVLNEQEAWGDVEDNIKPPTTSFINRLKEEWSIADCIISNSQHTKDSLIEHGVSAQKIIVVPLAYDSKCRPEIVRPPLKNRRPRVLFVGNVSLSKGFQYFAQAATQLKSEFEFVAAGNVLINQQFLNSQKWPVEYLNHLNKQTLDKEYSKADIFVFPTLSDGFGMVQLEAMSHGLPVIATDCCAQVVEDEKSGFIIPSKSVEAIIEKLLLIKDNQTLYNKMSENARIRAKSFSLDNLEALFN